MDNYEFIDAFALFDELWPEIKQLPFDMQAETWVDHFTVRYPALARMYIEAHAEDGEDWCTVLRERFFARAHELLTAMRRAAALLPNITREVADKARQMHLIDFPVVFMMLGPAGYAGWGARHEGRRACLFGLDAIADLGWQEARTLEGLTAHELGHVIYAEWRERDGIPDGKGPFWQLYREGFAQNVEHTIAGEDSWHMEAPTAGWAAWCADHVSYLANEFLKTARHGQPVHKFFGSLPHLNICGYRQTGYFLGSEAVRRTQSRMGIKAASLLDRSKVDDEVVRALEELAEGQPVVLPDLGLAGDTSQTF